MRKFFNITAKSDKTKKQFTVYSTKGCVVKIAYKMARNLFYRDDVKITNIFQIKH